VGTGDASATNAFFNLAVPEAKAELSMAFGRGAGKQGAEVYSPFEMSIPTSV
jgi:hypothetical protein